MRIKRFAEHDLPPDIQEAADNMNTFEAEVPPFEMLPSEPERSRALELFNAGMYGEIPPSCELEFILKSEGSAFDGLALRREIDIICRRNGLERTLHMLLYIPARRQGKVPCFFGLNLVGNIDTSTDPEVSFYPFKPYPSEYAWLKDCRVEAGMNGGKAYRWEFEKVLKAGFASATVCCFDCFPDHPDGFEESVMPLFYERSEWESPRRRSGCISAWAWGIMRAVDCLCTLPEIDAGKIVVHGLSRLGKTALWAGANDPRIALTASICSGTGGAKLTRRYFGESLEWLMVWRKYWFVPALEKYSKRDTEIPFDQHQLMALIAPRKLYVASADLDDYADPRGEFLAAQAAAAAWPEVQNLEGFPAPGCGTGDRDVRYFLRKGEHDFTPENWDDLIWYAKKSFNME